MIKYLIVSLGAGLGGAFRYWLSNLVYKYTFFTFPIGTLTVNFLGSFFLGFVIFYLDEKELISANLKLFLTIGFCGGFTTFSTFSFETLNLFRDAQYQLAFTNIVLSVLLCLLGIYFAYIITRF